ncbi:MAG: hypothetical protein WCA17_10100 [Burkholderiales bacterium]
MRHPAARTQRGAGLLWNLVVLALAAGGAYYLYRAFSVDEQRPGCASLLEGCSQRCRTTTTDNDAAEACQSKCEENNKACVARQADGK